ncbi:MAG TPA: zf-TFIIB domain-containing protein [Tepidisphaeraceae bacterium]|jgi:hypothetical protein
MECPRCHSDLIVTQRQGVEIDTCSKCRGVWLDRGELDKLINRHDAYDEEDEPRSRPEYREHHHPKRKSFWQEMFD